MLSSIGIHRRRPQRRRTTRRRYRRGWSSWRASSVSQARAFAARRKIITSTRSSGDGTICLGACSTAALCKSMIMENTRLSGVSAAEAAGLGRYKRVCVVLQYDGPKLDKHKLTDVVRGLEGRHAAAKRQYSLRMVSGEESLALSGFNPFAM